MSNKYRKEINGHINVTISIPVKFFVDAVDEVYEDDKGHEYVEADYQYGIEDVVSQSQFLQEQFHQFRTDGWKTKEITIEEQ